MPRELSYEKVTQHIAGHVIASELSDATPEQISEAEARYKAGKCPHTIVFDEPGYMYDFRYCHTCGTGLGLI